MDTDIHTEETAQIQDDSGCLDTGCGCGCCIIFIVFAIILFTHCPWWAAVIILLLLFY